MDNKEDWNIWRSQGIISCDLKLLNMINDLVITYRYLSKIDCNYYKIVIDRIVNEWYSLTLIARSRNISNYSNIKNINDGI